MILKLLPKINQTNLRNDKIYIVLPFYLSMMFEKWTDVGKVKNDEEK